MRTKVTLVLLFLNAALFFFIFHFERNWRTERAAMEVRPRVLGPEAADIRSLDVTGPSTGSYRLEKRGDTWFLTQPIEWPAKPDVVRGIISALQFLEHRTSFSVRDVIRNGLSLADYGLDHPKLVVTFTSGGPDTTGGAPITTVLKIGDTTKSGEQLTYLLSPDGTRIHVIGRELAESLSRSQDQLLADTVLTIPPFEARSLSIQPGVTTSVRLRRDGSRWTFERPVTGARADKTAVEMAINDLDGLRLGSFAPANPSVPLPSAEPELRVAIEGDNRSETLYLGAAVDIGQREPAGAPSVGADREYYAQLDGRPALFTVVMPAKLLGTLRNASEELRDRHVLDFDPEAVTAIILAAPNRNQPEITLQRLEAPVGAADGAGWQLIVGGDTARGPQTLAADRGAVQRLLSQLALLTAETFLSDAPQSPELENWGFSRPERQITLTLASSPPSSRIVMQIGRTTPPDRFAYAFVPNTQSVTSVDPGILDETRVDPLNWRDRQVRTLAAGAKITSLRLSDLKDGSLLLDWKAGQEPAKPVRDLLAGLGSLRAKRFLSDSFTADGVKNIAGEDRPWRYRLEASISLHAGAGGEQRSASALFLTERISGDEQLAGSQEFNVDFAVEQPVIDALWTLTYGARDPGPLPAAQANPPVAPGRPL
jgi:hypothetical protein